MAVARIDEIIKTMTEMSETLEGCDWCCGGGDEQMEQLTDELTSLGAKRGGRGVWLYPDGTQVK
jgi:hypothetical protein